MQEDGPSYIQYVGIADSGRWVAPPNAETYVKGCNTKGIDLIITWENEEWEFLPHSAKWFHQWDLADYVEFGQKAGFWCYVLVVFGFGSQPIQQIILFPKRIPPHAPCVPCAPPQCPISTPVHNCESMKNNAYGSGICILCTDNGVPSLHPLTSTQNVRWKKMWCPKLEMIQTKRVVACAFRTGDLRGCLTATGLM